MILYFVIVFFGFGGFVFVLGVGGVLSGGVTGVMALIVNLKSKRKAERKPEFIMPINWFVVGVLSLIFIFGIVVELVL